MDLGKEISVGQTLSLDKGVFTGNVFGIGVGWKAVNGSKKVDCDVWGVELDANGKYTGNLLDIGFYALLNTDGSFRKNPDGSNMKDFTHNLSKSVIAPAKDNTDGVDDPNLKDDEFLKVYLDNVPATSAGVAVCLNIFDGSTKGQTFGSVEELYLRLVRGDDQDGEPVAGLKLNPSKLVPNATALHYVSFVRQGAGWNYEGRGKQLGDAEQGSRINTAAPLINA